MEMEPHLIPISHNVCVTHLVVHSDNSLPRSNGRFHHLDHQQLAWRVALHLEGNYWAIPMVFACQRDAKIAARSVASHFDRCTTVEMARVVVRKHGPAWLRQTLTENLRW